MGTHSKKKGRTRAKKESAKRSATLIGIAPDRRSMRARTDGIALVRAGFVLAPTVVGGAVSLAIWSIVPLVIGIIVGLLLLANVHIVLEWEAAVVMRFGRLARISGPGLTFTLPFVEFIGAYVDQRITATTFRAEKTLTADCMPVDVDAVLFWMVWDPKAACLEVSNYHDAVFWAAQTTLRDAIGTVNVSELSTQRRIIDEEIKRSLTKKTETWGITVVSVEIRDIVIPEDLQDALSKEAQAERERNARVTLAEAEEDISEMFVRAHKNYREELGSMQLRAMNMLYDGMKEKGGLVLLPSKLADAFSQLENAIANESAHAGTDADANSNAGAGAASERTS